MPHRKSLAEEALEKIVFKRKELHVRVVDFGDFSIVTRCEAGQGYAPCVILSAHGIKVNPDQKFAGFMPPSTKKDNPKFKSSVEYFRLAPDDSSTLDIGYTEIMKDSSKLIVGIQEDSTELGKIFRQNEVVDNVILTPYYDEKESTPAKELERVKQAVKDQSITVWDIIVINKKTTLEDVIRRLEIEKISYSLVVGYHCSTRHDGLDHGRAYRQGYQPL